MGAPGRRMLWAARAARTMVVTVAVAGSALGVRLLSWYALQIERGCRALIGSTGRRMGLALVLLATVLSGTLGQLANAGIGMLPTAHAQARSSGSPHHFDPKSGTTSTIHLPPTSQLPPFTPQKQRPSMAQGFTPSMQPYLLKLDPTTGAHFLGSDGRLEIDVPAGAVTASDVTAAGGSMSLRVSEIAPGSGSNAGGSDVISLGSYLAEVVDKYGDPAAHGLRKPATLKLHYGSRDATLDLDSAFVVFNGAHHKSISGLGPYSTQNVTHDRKNHVLQVQLPADTTLAISSSGGAGGLHGAGAAIPFTQQTPNTSFSWDTYPPVAKFGSPDPFNVDLNAGSLTEGLKIDVPPGPAGAMPNITLAYNSAAVSEQHSPQGAAGWVGEGWSMSLGSISWAEHNVWPTCAGTSCYNTWQSTWNLTDPFGTSTELIPPNLGTATYYDDSNNWWCTTGNASSTACPIQFHTARETYAKVYAYVGPLTLGAAPDHPACFRVYLANGVMEEFGCTADSLQYYPLQASSMLGQNLNDVYYPVNWMLDLITNPQGDQVHITYQNDTQTAPDGLTYPRDTVMSTIEWDSPGCVNAQTMCTGTAWQPLYRVSFAANHHTVTRLTNTPAGCNTGSSVRCDDPLDLSGSGGLRAPLVNGTFVLNDIQVQTNTSTNGGGTYNGSSWNTVRDYQLSYEQSGPTTQLHDPVTGKQVSTAGYLDLTKIQEVGADGTTAFPATTFGYTSQTEYYEDGSYTPYSTSYCGPSWNTGGNGGTCDLWSQTYDGNSRYLSSASNGQGLQQTFTWLNARNNTHGVNTGGTPADPLYCTNNQTSTYPCSEADDQAWSRVVVTQRTDAVQQVTQSGQGGAQTSIPVTSQYAYTYQLSYPLVAQECGDCVAGMYWGNQNDDDYLDYYNGHFMGFAQASVSKPDGSVETHKYYATEGWGVYDTSLVTSCPSTLPPISTTCHAAPWWHLANAGHGLEYEADYYDTNGTTLLKKTTAQYQAVCPPSGVTATPSYSEPTTGGGTVTFGPWGSNLVSELDHNNPVATCDVRQTQQVTTTSDGTSNSVTDTEAYTYDSYGRVTQTTRTSNSGGGSPTQIIHKASYVWDDGLSVPAAARSNTPQTSWGGSYLIDVTASTDTEDGGGTQYACQRTNYDGQAYTTGQTSNLTTANTTEQDRYSQSCGTTPSGALTRKTAYDTFGNVTSTTDADGSNGDTSHQAAACSGATSCSTYDPTTQAKTTSSTNANSQQTNTNYDPTSQAYGYGLWPKSMTDANGQTTTFTYDPLGRMTSVQAPGQSSPPTQSTAYANWCSGTGAQASCVEVDSTKRIDSSTTVTTRQFYDGQGRVVETRTPAPGGQDVVQYLLYTAAGQAATSSVSYFVAAYTGAAGSTAYSIPDSTQVVTTVSYDGLGRALSATDPLSNMTQMAYSVVCSAPGTNDTGCYEQTLGTDANNHRHGSLVDGFGRQIYDQRYSGNSTATYAVYSTTKTTYDYNGRVTHVLHPNGTSTTSYTYDTAGRLLTLSDPDRGNESYAYDNNGNQTQLTDARGQHTYTGYDGLDRPIWRNTSSTASGAYVTYSYDVMANGSFGQGRLGAEIFRHASGTGADSFSGAYTYSYDALGRTTRVDQTMGGAGGCPTGWSCADIGSPALPGSQSFAGDGVWTVSGAGADIWGTSDQFHYVSQSQPGDGSVSVRVSSQSVSDPWAKAGVMLRASTASNAAYYAVEVTPGHNISVQYRASAGGSAAIQATANSGPSHAPAYVKVTRTGTSFTAYTSSDGAAWTPISGSTASIAGLSGTLLAGIAVASHNTGAASIATVDSINVTTGGTGACPSGWSCQDVGSPALAGTQNYSGDGVWTVSGAGADITGTSDQFHYVYQSQPGDGSVSVRVSSQTVTDPWAKAGVMLRASTASNAAFYAVEVTPSHNISIQYRASTGANVAIQATTLSGPTYVKITRTGTSFTAYTSSDGTTWTPNTGSTISIPALSGTLLAGIEVCSHNTGALSIVTVDHVSPTATPPASVTTSTAGAPSGTTSYPVSSTYDDAGNVLSQTYPDGETVRTNYTPQEWLTGLTTQQGSTTTTLLNGVTYTGPGGAAGQMTGATLANGTYTYAATYDLLARATDSKLTRSSDSAVLFDQTRTFDAVGNVATVGTTMPTGTDNQAYCYDEQNRLTWASSASSSIPCGGTLSAGTLTSAQYGPSSYSFDTLDRLTNAGGNSYTYGSGAHLHAATAIGTNWTASYDAAGDMTCRAPTNTTTCAGASPTGAQLGYDTEGRLATWQDTLGGTSDQFLYDGSGQRVEQQVSNGGVTTTTTYVGQVEELRTTGGTTTTTTYYYAGGKRVALAVNGTFSYLGTDGLGSASVALDGSGSVQASVLYGPYGAVRYSSGTMPGSYGYTGQQADATTGLDYYNARYYDASAGQFASADTAQDGLNRYGYVHGNPTTLTDPTGHCGSSSGGGSNGGGSGGGGGGGHTMRGACGGPGGDGGSPDTRECGTYTQAQCDQARSAQFMAVRKARLWAAGWQILMFLAGGVVDLLAAFADWGKLSLNTVIDVGTDFAGMLADIGLLFASIGNLAAAFMGDDSGNLWLRNLGGTLLAFGLWMKAGLAAIKANTGFWVNIAKASFYALLMASSVEVTGGLEASIDLIDVIADSVLQALGSATNWRQFLGTAVLGGLQALAADQSAAADIMAGEKPFGYCTSEEGKRDPACPKI